MENPRKLHPLIATAAAGVIMASLAATAAITGLLPRASSSSARNDPIQNTQLAQQPVMNSAAPQHALPKAAVCASCGTVESVVPVRRAGHSSGLGAVGGAVAGGVIGNQFGGGGGRTAMTLLGALGGGLAGNSVEKHLRSETDYQVRVRMQTGKLRYFTYRQPPPFQHGERVRVENGTLVHAG